mmetsp:Transcript_4518/g.11146  ORF Transcript_4518/g.11146 Transcript_4518/m.11146 type:complete len:205 (+) Transcript_4518:229-843(+)
MRQPRLTFAKPFDVDVDELTADPDTERRLRLPWEDRACPRSLTWHTRRLSPDGRHHCTVAQERLQLHPRHHQPHDQPHGTHLTSAWDRLKAWGDNVRGILLPTRINDFIGLELKHLQKDINFQGLRPQLMGSFADVSIVPTCAGRTNMRLLRGRWWRRALRCMTSSRTRWSSTRRSQLLRLLRTVCGNIRTLRTPGHRVPQGAG